MFSSEDPRFDEHQDDDEKHGAPDEDHDGCTCNRWSSNFERSILQWLDLNLNQGLQRFKVWKLHIFSFHIELWFSRLFDSRKFSIVSIVHPFLRLLVLSKLDVRGCQLSVPDMNVDGAGPLALPPTCLLPSVIYTALSKQPHVPRWHVSPAAPQTHCPNTAQWAVTQWAKCLSILTIKSVNKGSLPKIEIKYIDVSRH